MDPLSVVLVVTVLGVSLFGTSLIVRLVNGELSRVGEELRELRNKQVQLLNENEALRKEVSELRKSLDNALSKQGGLEDRILVVERLVKERLSGKAKNTERKKGTTDPHLDLKIIALRNRGLSIRQIAKELGISKSRVHRILKKAFKGGGLEVTTRKEEAVLET